MILMDIKRIQQGRSHDCAGLLLPFVQVLTGVQNFPMQLRWPLQYVSKDEVYLSL